MDHNHAIHAPAFPFILCYSLREENCLIHEHGEYDIPTLHRMSSS